MSNMRGILESGRRDVQEVDILGRTLRWTEKGLEYEAGDKLTGAFARLGVERRVEDGQKRGHEGGNQPG